jgi:hypothetical protein
MKNIFVILMLSIASLCQAQKSKLNYKRIYEDIESQKLEGFLTADLKVDTVSSLQYAWVFIKVYNSKRIDSLATSGMLDEKFKKIIENNIHKKNVPWLKKNKGTTMWYVLPIVYGHIQSNLNERQVYMKILADEINLSVVSELMRDKPNKVFIFNTYRRLSNHGMQTIGYDF